MHTCVFLLLPPPLPTTDPLEDAISASLPTQTPFVPNLDPSGSSLQQALGEGNSVGGSVGFSLLQSRGTSCSGVAMAQTNICHNRRLGLAAGSEAVDG